MSDFRFDLNPAKPGFQQLEARIGADELIARGLAWPLPSAQRAEHLQALVQAELADRGLLLWDTPRLEVQQQDTESLSFSASLPVLPKPELPDLGRLKVEVPELPVSAGLLEQVAALQHSLAAAQSIPGPADWQMRLHVDAIGFVNGIPIPDSVLRGEDWLLSPELMFPGFAKQLLGLRPGQARDISVQLPPDYPIPAWAGQKALFKVKLHRIERLRLPALDDAFARLSGQGDSLRELERKLLTQLEVQASRDWTRHILESALDTLLTAMALELPEALLEAQLTRVWEQTQVPRLQAQGLQAAVIAKALPFWLSHRALRSQTRRNLQVGLLYQLLLEREGSSLSGAELEHALAETASGFGLSLEQAQAQLEQQGLMSELKQRLLRQKAEATLLTQVRLYAGGERIELGAH